MATGKHLIVEPQDVQFSFELNKRLSCTIKLTNKTDQAVAFKVKTTNPKKYCVRPNVGLVLPHSELKFVVTRQEQKEAPPDLQCKDKFLIQSAIEIFNKDSGKIFEEYKMKVHYVPPQPPASPPHQPASPPHQVIEVDANKSDEEVLRSEIKRGHGDVSLMYLGVGFASFLLGYLINQHQC